MVSIDRKGTLCHRQLVTVRRGRRSSGYWITSPSPASAIEPRQAEFYQLWANYHRAPGGESWCDVILRLRSVMDTIALHHADRQVMIFAHQVEVLCLRYIIEGMTDAVILAIDRAGKVANASTPMPDMVEGLCCRATRSPRRWRRKRLPSPSRPMRSPGHEDELNLARHGMAQTAPAATGG